MAPLGHSDHESLQWTFVCYDKPPLYKQHKIFNFFKGEYQSMNSYLSRIPWQDLLCENNLEENWSFFKQTIHEAQEMFVPVFSGKRKNHSNNHWWSKHLQLP